MRSTLVAVVAFACLVTGCSAVSEASPSPVTMTVVHHGRRVRVRLQLGASAEEIVRRAKVRPVDGSLRSAVRHRALRANGRPATFTVAGTQVARNSVPPVPVTITVTDGTDTVERTVTRRVPLAAGGLPKALQYVQYAGRPGLASVTKGAVSGEVVSTRTIRPAVPAHRATGPVVALTFDDGPDPAFTPQILEILRRKKVKATFCQVGTLVEAHPDLVRAVLDGGHRLCNHTQHHVERLETQPLATVRAEIGGGRAAQVAAVEQAAPFYRPPGGSLGPSVYQVAAENRQAVLYWSVDPRDWKRPPAAEVAIRVVTALQPGAIILLHDGGGDRAATVEALPGIIDYIRALGYTLTLPTTTVRQVG